MTQPPLRSLERGMVPALPSPHLCMPCPRLTAPPGSPSLLPSAFHTRLSWVGTISVTRWKCILSSFGDVRVSWPFFIRSDPPLKFPPLPWDPGCFGPFGRVRSSMAFPFILYLLQPPACLWHSHVASLPCSFVTTTFVVEAMAAANAQLRWKRMENHQVCVLPLAPGGAPGRLLQRGGPRQPLPSLLRPGVS